VSGATARAEPLPQFIPPMLAVQGTPFDSKDYLFELKWDGVRAMAFAEAGAYRIINRRRVDITSRYPELTCLTELPEGTVIDGEIVSLNREGKPDFHALQSREHTRNPHQIKALSRSTPATFIAFDQLYARGKSIMNLSCESRRRRLRAMLKRCETGRIMFSQSVNTKGKAFFEATCEQGLEGVMAKRRNSAYSPGSRNSAWIKIKRQRVMICAIMGFVAEGRDIRTLVICGERNGEAVCVGRVGSGIDRETNQQLYKLLSPLIADEPCIPCQEKATWVSPEVYCKVRYLEQTDTGNLRFPVFVEMCHGN
jgi:DNA ligase D-like protein (predicted ligase)